MAEFVRLIDVDRMAELYRQGRTTPDIGVALGVPQRTVYRRLVAAGVPLRTAWHAEGRRTLGPAPRSSRPQQSRRDALNPTT